MSNSRIECPLCKTGLLALVSRYRLSGPVVVIGWLLLVPSFVGMTFGLVCLAIALMTAGETTKVVKRLSVERLQAANIPDEIIEALVNRKEISPEQKEMLSENQRRIVDSQNPSINAMQFGTGFGVAISGGIALAIFLSSFVSGLIGWLLVMRKRVLVCGFCCAVWPAS